MKCKFYLRSPKGTDNKCLNPSCRLRKCWFTDPQNECECFEPIEENKEEFKDMKKCKSYSNHICKYYWNDSCHYSEKVFGGSPASCHCVNDFENNCICFEPSIEYEKESSPYNLNSTEVKVFSKLFKEYIKDQDKLDKVVETFKSYLSNSSKSPANAEGKCSDEGTFYRVMKGRIENKEEPEVISAKLMTDIDTCMDPRTLTIQNCDKIILKPRSLEVEVKIEKDNFDDFDYIVINGHRFKKV